MCYFLLTLLVFSTTNAQELKNDSLPKKSKKISDNELNEQVVSYAKDSIIYDILNNKIYLYNDAEIKYESVTLKAAFIELDSDKNIVFAKSLVNDTTGEKYGFPLFIENDKSFNSEEITYNFNTKKGIIKEVRTQEGEGYIIGKKVKKNSDDIIYTSRGRYTTCDADTPHFSIRANKIKTIPNNKIITGPAFLEFSGVPTPLALPFGFFRIKKTNIRYHISNIWGIS